AKLFFKKNQPQKALEYFNKSASIIEKLVGKKHPEYIHALVSLGVLFAIDKDFEKALTYHLQALEANFLDLDSLPVLTEAFLSEIPNLRFRDPMSVVNCLVSLQNLFYQWNKIEPQKYDLELLRHIGKI